MTLCGLRRVADQFFQRKIVGQFLQKIIQCHMIVLLQGTEWASDFRSHHLTTCQCFGLYCVRRAYNVFHNNLVYNLGYSTTT